MSDQENNGLTLYLVIHSVTRPLKIESHLNYNVVPKLGHSLPSYKKEYEKNVEWYNPLST